MFVNSGMKVWKREEQFMNNVKVQTKLIIVMLTTIVALVLCAVISSESMSKRLKNCISGRIPKVDAVRDLLSRINPDEIRSIHEEMIDIIKRNQVFREGTIGG